MVLNVSIWSHYSCIHIMEISKAEKLQGVCQIILGVPQCAHLRHKYLFEANKYSFAVDVFNMQSNKKIYAWAQLELPIH